MDAGVLFQGVVWRGWGWVSFLEVGSGWGLGDGCMESVQFVSQLHGRSGVKIKCIFLGASRAPSRSNLGAHIRTYGPWC